MSNNLSQNNLLTTIPITIMYLHIKAITKKLPLTQKENIRNHGIFSSTQKYLLHIQLSAELCLICPFTVVKDPFWGWWEGQKEWHHTPQNMAAINHIPNALKTGIGCFWGQLYHFWQIELLGAFKNYYIKRPKNGH